MKRLLLLVVGGLLMVACSSTNTHQTTIPQADQIVDQEFDNMAIPNDNYNRVTPYEEQISGSSYIQSTSGARKNTQKPSRTVKTQTTVVDGDGRILSPNTSVGVTDQEALPDELPTEDITF